MTPALDHAFPASLPQANVRPPGEFPAEEFVNIPDVPVFAEHTATGRDGRTLRYSAAELQAVAERCNRRIRETGDYAGLCIGHTPELEAVQAGTARYPDLVGFAGPFKLGLIGEGQKKRYAILAD